MKIKDIMTSNPSCCMPTTGLIDVAKMMVSSNCGEIPVVESRQSMRPVGIVTDRDIVCRLVALGKNPAQLSAADCMSSPAVTISQEASLEECCQLMERRQIRRIPVVDAKGVCCGIVAQADLARRAPDWEAAQLIRQVSQPVRTAAMAA